MLDGASLRFVQGIISNLNQLVTISENEVNRAGELIIKQYKQQLKIIISTMLVIVILSILLSLWTIRSILTPIAKISVVLKELSQAKGDLSSRVNLDTGDEIEQMGNYLTR